MHGATIMYIESSHVHKCVLVRGLRDVQTFAKPYARVRNDAQRNPEQSQKYSQKHLLSMVSVIWCGLEDVELHFGGDVTTKHEYGAKRYSSPDFCS